MTTRAHALNPTQRIIQYAHRTWTLRGGFTKRPVFAITQTPDGYLWLGTGFGFLRFDGVRRPVGAARGCSSSIPTRYFSAHRT